MPGAEDACETCAGAVSPLTAGVEFGKPSNDVDRFFEMLRGPNQRFQGPKNVRMR